MILDTRHRTFYYCLCRILLALICSSVANMLVAQISNPTEITGLSAWWCADSVQQDDGSAVSIWYNMANTAESVTQPVTDNCPTLVKDVSELNNHAVLRFDGTDYLDGGNILNVGKVGQTVFCLGMIQKKNGSFYSKSLLGSIANRHCLIYENTPEYLLQIGSKNYMPTGPMCLGEYVLFSGRINLQDQQVYYYQNGYTQTLDLPIAQSIVSNFEFYIGTYNDKTGMAPYDGLNLNGDIAEMIFYNRPLSNIERQKVENYLRSKYFPGTEREQFSLGGDVERAYGFKPITLSVPEREYFQTYEWNTGEHTQSISISESGLYSVHVTDDWGYDYIDTVHVVLPSFSYIPSQTICDGQSVEWDCGLSGDYTYLWSTGEETQSITISKAGKYAVKVIDNQGYSLSSDTVTISVDDFSTAARLGADTTLCQGNEIGLISRDDEVVDYLWNTGGKSKSLVIQESGTYSVTVTNKRGCVATDEIEITVEGVAPVAQFVSQNHCFADTTEFLSDSYTTDNTQIQSTKWIVESDTIEGISSKHCFSKAGTFPVLLKITNEAGCVSVTKGNVEIHEKPVAQFSPKIACQYTACNIMSTSKAGTEAIVAFEWKGDGISSEKQSIQFLSDKVGEYPITLRVESEYGCADTVSDNITVVESPKVEFVHTRSCIGDTVLFIDETNCLPYNYMLSGQWEFDGTVLPYKKILMARLTDTLPHIVGLYVKTFNGCLNIAYDTIRVHDLPHPRVQDVLYGCVGEDIVLQDIGTSADAISEIKWTIDGKTKTEAKPIVRFNESGTYDYSLAITSEFECANETSGHIVVEKTPVADFSFFPEYGAAPLYVQFTNTSVDAATSLWTFESSVEVDEENPEYTFTDEATSFVQLRVSSEHGCADSVTKYVSVQLSNMKLQITDFQVVEQNGKVLYRIQVLNSGNDIIPEIEFSVSSPDFPTLSELWTGKLPPNSVLSYDFSAKTALKNNEFPAYVCVDASIASSNQQQTFYNDRLCKDFSDEFNVYSVSPNPVKDIALLAFSTKQSETVVVECVDEFGKVRLSQEIPSLSSGFHTYSIDLTGQPSGIYVVWVRQGNKKIPLQVIKE